MYTHKVRIALSRATRQAPFQDTPSFRVAGDSSRIGSSLLGNERGPALINPEGSMRPKTDRILESRLYAKSLDDDHLTSTFIRIQGWMQH
jgi:hypothetical protein